MLYRALLALGLTLSGEAAPNGPSITLEGDVFRVSTNRFSIPFEEVKRPHLERVREIIIWTSDDEGKNWQPSAPIDPESKRFRFLAPKDRTTYWFAAQAVYKDGSKDPANVRDLRPQQKVHVD